MTVAAQEEQHPPDAVPELTALSFGLLEGMEDNTSSPDLSRVFLN